MPSGLVNLFLVIKLIIAQLVTKDNDKKKIVDLQFALLSLERLKQLKMD